MSLHLPSLAPLPWVFIFFIFVIISPSFLCEMFARKTTESTEEKGEGERSEEER